MMSASGILPSHILYLVSTVKLVVDNDEFYDATGNGGAPGAPGLVSATKDTAYPVRTTVFQTRLNSPQHFFSHNSVLVRANFYHS